MNNKVITILLFQILSICLYSQNVDFGISSSMGYDFYSRSNNKENLSDFYNPNLSMGIITELQTDEEFFFSFGYKFNKSQRKYKHIRESYIPVSNFTRISIRKVNKVISSSNLYLAFGIKFKQTKFSIGANYSRISNISNNGSTFFDLTTTGQTTRKLNIHTDKDTQIGLIAELNLRLYNNFELVFSYLSFKSERYRSNYPRRRITFGIYHYIIQN